MLKKLKKEYQKNTMLRDKKLNKIKRIQLMSNMFGKADKHTNFTQSSIFQVNFM